MDTINHADQMRLANLINDNSDDAEIQRKLDQVIELTNSTRDQAAVALHDCHYDVEKAVDMILEGDHANVENEWKSAGKRKNKNSQGPKFGTTQQSGGDGSNKNAGLHKGYHNQQTTSATSNSGPTTTNSGAHHVGGSHRDSHHHHHHQAAKGNNQSSSAVQSSSNQVNNNTINQSHKLDTSDSFKSVTGLNSSNLINSSDSPSTTSATVATTNKVSSLHQQSQQIHSQQQSQPQQQPQQQSRHKGNMQTGIRQHQRSTRIPESAVEMPNNEPQLSSLNVQFGELDLKDTNVNANDSKGTFQDVLESSRLGRQPSLSNSHSPMSTQDNKGNRQMPQHNMGRGGSRRPYNNSGDDRRFYYNRGGRQPQAGGPRPYQQRPGPMGSGSVNNRGVRTILNRGLQPNSGLSTSSSNQQSSGFPNSIDTWTNSTAEVATKQPSNTDQTLGGVGGTLRVGQWSDVAGNEDWSEEEHWDAKVMETKVFTPSSKAIDDPVTGPKNQSLITDSSVPPQINLTSKMPEVSRNDLSSQTTNLNAVATQVQAQQASQKPLSHLNDIFDHSVAKVLEQQNLAALKPKTSIGISHYSKDSSDPKTVLDSQNLGSMKPKSAVNMNQYSKDASESLKSLVGISSSASSAGGAKGGVPSVPPGALPLISQPQYIMGNAYQPAMFPYAYQAPDVHYPVAAPAAGRDQNFPSVYSPNWWISINGYQQQMSGNGPQQFGFSHNAQQPSSLNSYPPLLQPHNLDNSDLNTQSGAQSQLQHSSAPRAGSQVNSSKYYNAYQQQMSSNGPQQFGFSHSAQQPSSMNYPLLPHNLDSSDLNPQGNAQSQLQHSSAQRGGSQVNPNKQHYQSWNLGS